ncbi:MAG: replication-associated recombination protein A [Acidobacteria bacterium]|nr:replication-associated recombination protein A [Acidobacteriota bacterium]MBI3655089.1 replication-associated recombination protein A [Acidobacteriota bacterium]
MSLFDNTPRTEAKSQIAPLADRMRPRSLAEFIGQAHLVAEGKVLSLAIMRDEISSMILWGPPGSGKTSLASIMAAHTHAHFITYSAVTSGIKEIKQVMMSAEKYYQSTGKRTLLFIDEIHRFNKAQQDAFLPYVESGEIILIGATTENPSFEINAPLLSRVKVYVLYPLTPEHIVHLLSRALADKERGLGSDEIEIEEGCLMKLAVFANGDARGALNALEATVRLLARPHTGTKRLTNALIEDALQKKLLMYDKQGEEHFNLISALHKSMRNSDPDAALYWLGRMLEAGEDPLYVARRLVRFASEDIGLADPQALNAALNSMNAVHFIGMPEGKLALAQAALYLSVAPKSNAIYRAYHEVEQDIQKTIHEPVPLHLRNAPTDLMKQLGYGDGYQYAHDNADRVTGMSCLPERLRGRRYYHPTEQGLEKKIKEVMAAIEALKKTKYPA